MSDDSERALWQQGGDTQRSIGNLEGRLGAVEGRLSAMEAKLDQVLERTNMAKGGLQVLIGIGTLGAGLGAGITELLHWWHLK